MATVSDLDAGFFDSSGLAMLASWQIRARSGDVRFVLRGVQEGVGRVLDVSGMRAMFTTE